MTENKRLATEQNNNTISFFSSYNKTLQSSHFFQYYLVTYPADWTLLGLSLAAAIFLESVGLLGIPFCDTLKVENIVQLEFGAAEAV